MQLVFCKYESLCRSRMGWRNMNHFLFKTKIRYLGKEANESMLQLCGYIVASQE